MKKKLIFLANLILTSTLTFSQSNILEQRLKSFQYQVQNSHLFKVKESFGKGQLQNKATGDTIAYEDFDGGLPNNWSIVNNSANNFNWIWDTVAKNGMSTLGLNSIRSLTAANGFMSLPSGFYNTPRPLSGSLPMHTYFKSDSILIPQGKDSSLWLSYQQCIVHCCRPTTTTASTHAVRYFRIGSDSITFTIPNIKWFYQKIDRTIFCFHKPN